LCASVCEVERERELHQQADSKVKEFDAEVYPLATIKIRSLNLKWNFERMKTHTEREREIQTGRRREKKF